MCVVCKLSPCVSLTMANILLQGGKMTSLRLISLTL
jgi:hypothetical protein